MTRGEQTLIGVAVVTGVLMIVLPVALVVVLVREANPDPDDARSDAQAAVDRALPGQVRVVEASDGYPGGYRVRAHLVVDPSVRVEWRADRRCDPGSACEQRMVLAVANARDRVPERAALERAWTSCGAVLRGAPTVRHSGTVSSATRRSINATLSLVLPRTDLEGPGMAAAAARLDACAAGWARERGPQLLPVERYTTNVQLTDADGGAHSSVRIEQLRDRVTSSAASGIRPVLGAPGRREVSGRLEGPVRAFMQQMGPADHRVRGITASYLPGTVQRLEFRVTLTRLGTTGPSPGRTRQVALVADPDGRNPADLRLVR